MIIQYALQYIYTFLFQVVDANALPNVVNFTIEVSTQNNAAYNLQLTAGAKNPTTFTVDTTNFTGSPNFKTTDNGLVTWTFSALSMFTSLYSAISLY